jgi:hypothetical protein
MQGGENGRRWTQKDSICRHICNRRANHVQLVANKRRETQRTSSQPEGIYARDAKGSALSDQSSRRRAHARGQGVPSVFRDRPWGATGGKTTSRSGGWILMSMLALEITRTSQNRFSLKNFWSSNP